MSLLSPLWRALRPALLPLLVPLWLCVATLLFLYAVLVCAVFGAIDPEDASPVHPPPAPGTQ